MRVFIAIGAAAWLSFAAQPTPTQSGRSMTIDDLLGAIRVTDPQLSADGSRVVFVRTTTDLKSILIAVEDSGAGLDPEQAGRVFEAFYTTKQEGLGMGLSISRSIVEAHGGRLWASPNATFGATFQFTLPIEEGVAA